MSETLVAVVLGGAFTLVGGLAGALLTAWLDNRKAEKAHNRERRAIQRSHAIEVIDAGRDWGTNLLAAMLILASDLSVNDLPDLEQWKTHLASTARYRRSLRASELVFNDSQVLQVVRSLVDHLETQHAVMQPLATKKLHGVKPTQAEGQAVLDFNDRHSALLDEFVAAATKLVD